MVYLNRLKLGGEVLIIKLAWIMEVARKASGNWSKKYKNFDQFIDVI
jgi:hypothetical protein